MAHPVIETRRDKYYFWNEPTCNFWKDIGESRERALEIGQEKGLMYINGFDHPNILAGQA